jgi:hypothetical protein
MSCNTLCCTREVQAMVSAAIVLPNSSEEDIVWMEIEGRTQFVT